MDYQDSAVRVLSLCLVGLLMGAPVAPSAQQAGTGGLAGPELLAALRGGGFVVYFRHADTDHRQNDTRTGSVEDCANQRNLTERGREHASSLGEAIRALKVPIGLVLASPLCRTVETATLAFGSAERAPAAREAGPEPPGSPERFAALRVLLSTMPAKGTNTVVVAHAYPFYTLVGGQYLDEGEAAVVRPDGAGFQVVTRLGLKEWREMANPPR